MTTASSEISALRWLNIPKPPADSVDFFRVESLDGRPQLQLARSSEGFALLVEESGEPRAPIALRNLTVRFNASCQVEEGRTKRAGSFTIVACTSADRYVQTTFVQAAAALLASREDGAGIGAVVEGLVELFRVASRPPQSTVLGVWGELFTIRRAHDLEGAIAGWRSTAHDRHDFARGTERVEIKTATGTRRHHFSLDQVTPADGISVLIVSIVTGSSAAGWTVLDLVRDLVSRVSTSFSTDQIMVKVGQALGTDLQRWSEDRFDHTLAESSCRVFGSEAVPRPTVDDPRVREVRFVADLGDVASRDVDPAHWLLGRRQTATED